MYKQVQRKTGNRNLVDIIEKNKHFGGVCYLFVFDVRSYFVEPLDGVLQQTYETLVAMILDDGSIAGSGEIGNQLIF